VIGAFINLMQRQVLLAQRFFIINDAAYISGGFRLNSIGNIGDYCVVANSSLANFNIIL
jgi:hypothetical protein